MQTVRQIPQPAWAAFFEELTGERRGEPVLLTVDWQQLGEEVEADHVLLQAFTYDARADVLEISVQRPSTSGPTILRHHVDAPALVEVDSPAGILPAEIRISGADGGVTVVRISPGISVSE